MDKFLQKTSLLIFIFLLFSTSSFSQTVITGQVSDADGYPLVGAYVYCEAENLNTITDIEGKYTITLNEKKEYELTFSYVGYRTIVENIQAEDTPIALNLALVYDPLELASIILTGTFNPNSKLETSIASTTLSEQLIQNSAALGTAELLSNVTGTFVDASAGSIFTRVYSRGISASAEEDIGWYYMSLQEDGLPVTNYHTTYYGPDLFQRADITTRRVEAVRGGSSMITSSNAPGGIFNFISKTGKDQLGIEMIATGALQGENNLLARYDLNIGGKSKSDQWAYNVGGFYRYDEGARNTDIRWDNGGQIKANVTRLNKNGFIRMYGKYLNDKVNRYQGLAATNWSDPQPAFGHDFNYTALNLPRINTDITDGRTASENPNNTYNYNTNNGIHTKDIAFGLKVSQEVSGWNINSNIKLSDKSSDWNSTIANQPLGLEGFFPYLLSGIDPTFQNIPLGNVVFRDANSQEVIARVNNFGILGPFMGEPASFEYLEGSLPNDALMGIAPWKKIDNATEFMGELKLSKEFKNHTLTTGAYYGYSDIESFTSASFAYSTYENNPRALYVTLENEGMPVVELSDPNGISNYGGLLYNRGDAQLNQMAVFANDNFKIGEHLKIDAGLRFDRVTHQGTKDRSSPGFNPGGIDNDELTAYNNSVLLATQQDSFDFDYSYISWSLGLNYTLSEDMALFARVSNGHKAPEMNYYFNNFDGVSINQAGTEQDIVQGEVGVKIATPRFSLFTTAFYSQLDNIAFSEFVLDQQDGSIFYTPIQLNKTTTIGLEIEGNVSLSNRFGIGFKATAQNPEATRFNIYNANETTDQSDDSISDFSGNKIPHNPNIMLEVSPTYAHGSMDAFISWRYMGERQGNVSNAFQLPAFSTINLGMGYQLNPQINLSLIVNNVFNSKGLMNFFGPNEFGSNSNAANQEYIDQNPDASFVVFPINPRSIFLKVGYSIR